MTSFSIIHMDMDAFFASVEQLDHPDLIGKCVVVGGSSNRGVVAAASYEARKYGIRSAMPIFQARQKCTELVIMPPRRKRYVELSRRIMSILNSFSPLVESVSIDEAYLDVTGCDRISGPPDMIAGRIKTKIKESTKLTCSVGVAPNKFLAKIASDFQKPDGLTIIKSDDVARFVQSLPITKVPGVGQMAGKKLNELGIQMLGQVQQVPIQTLVRKFGKFGYRLFDLSRGIDDSSVIPNHIAKSVSSETTLEADTSDKQILAAHLLAQSQAVAGQLRQHHALARNITLKLKTADFQRHSCGQTLDQPIRSADMIYRISLELLHKSVFSQPVRLIGVSAGGLQADTLPVQRDMFDTARDLHHQKWETVENVIDEVAKRYGHRYVNRGTLIVKSKKQNGD